MTIFDYASAVRRGCFEQVYDADREIQDNILPMRTKMVELVSNDARQTLEETGVGHGSCVERLFGEYNPSLNYCNLAKRFADYRKILFLHQSQSLRGYIERWEHSE